MSVTFTRDGFPEEACFDFCFSPVLDEAGAVMGIVQAAVETMEKPRNEQELRERGRRSSVIFSTAPVGLSEVSRTGRFMRVNGELCRILGRSSDEVRRLTVADVSHPDDIAPSFAAIAQALRTGRSASLDTRYRRRGTRVTVLITGDTTGDRLVEAKSNSTLMLHKPVNPDQLKALLTEAFVTS